MEIIIKIAEFKELILDNPDDYELFDTYSCGKNDQGIRVSAGGPSIRVKKLSIS